jgi:hypothetical protein
MASPFRCDTRHRYGRTVGRAREGDNPATYAFHYCILPHADSEHGMFGIVTALIVQM